MQIMNSITNPNYGWQNHPAKLMWEGFEPALYKYQEAIVAEWTSRGYKDNVCLDKTWAMLTDEDKDRCFSGQVDYPMWLGDVDFHLAHQSNLIRKFPEHYIPLFPGVPNDLEYVWPSRASV